MKIPFSVYDFFSYLGAGFVLLYTFDLSFEFGYIEKEELSIQLIALLIILSYTIGHVVSNISSFILEHTIVRKLLGSPEVILFSSPKQTILKYIFPIYFQPFPASFANAVLKRAKNEGFPEAGRALFFHCHSIAKKDAVTNERLTTFLNLYGFSRNMCMAFILVFLFLGIGAIIKRPDPSLYFLLMSGSLFLSIGLFYRYLKFFKHYTEEVFRTFESNTK